MRLTVGRRGRERMFRRGCPQIALPSKTVFQPLQNRERLSWACFWNDEHNCRDQKNRNETGRLLQCVAAHHRVAVHCRPGLSWKPMVRLDERQLSLLLPSASKTVVNGLRKPEHTNKGNLIKTDGGTKPAVVPRFIRSR